MSNLVELSKNDLENVVGQMMQNKDSCGSLIPQQKQQVMRVDADDLLTVLQQVSQFADAQSTMDHCMKHLHETGEGVVVIEEFEIVLEEIQ